jgi:hypothetical protein
VKARERRKEKVAWLKGIEAAFAEVAEEKKNCGEGNWS